MDLPLPEIRTVKEVVNGYPRTTVLIARDPNAGCKARYSVVRINHATGKARCIGRELDLALARKVARTVFGLVPVLVAKDKKPIL